jgi:DNA-binding NtrC family response regulator
MKIPGREGIMHILILEKDQAICEAVTKTLKEKSYGVTALAKLDEALPLFRENLYPLAIVGETEDGNSVFETMKKIVMASPMTSLVLICDLPKEEVDRKAEGYGILGHVEKTIPSEGLILLLEQFEKISQSIYPLKT